MSSTTRASAPGPLEARAGRTAAAPETRSDQAKDKHKKKTLPVGRMLRIDAPHAEAHTLRGPLAWIDYVQPAFPLWPSIEAGACSTSAFPVAASEVTAAEPQSVSRKVGPQPVLPAPERDRDIRAGLYRQRFYPEQWRRQQQPAIERLVAAHGQRLQWIGWERSLPKLYLPAGDLTRVIVGLLQVTLRRTPASAAGDQGMCLRVGWQIGVTQALVLVLEHPRLELPAPLIQYVNSPAAWPAADEPPGAGELVSVRSLVRALGGTISASRCDRGGTQFRLSLPVDDRTTLVRAWIEQAVQGVFPTQAAIPARRAIPAKHAAVPKATAAWTSVAQGGEAKRRRAIHQSQVSLYLIGRRQAETILALGRADAFLQSLAGSGDFVYRAARGRWIWLTMHSALPQLAPHDAWQTQLISRWSCLTQATLLTEQQAAAFHGLARAIVVQMDRVLGRRVPPLDLLIAPTVRAGRLRVDRPAAPMSRGPTQRAAHISLDAALSAVSTSSLRRRWRYPI